MRSSDPVNAGDLRWSLMYRRIGKPVLDRVAAGLGLFVLAPVFGVVAILVRIEGSGPILYRQQRVGFDGRLFTLLKFRTMVPGADVIGGGFAPPELNLITPLGHRLRRTSIDELPQLWNVLRGEMSLVGPRPALPELVARYTDHQRQRLLVRPGITGLSQIEGRNEWTCGVVGFERDIDYVENVSLALDLRILAGTIRPVLMQSGYVADQTADDVDDL